MISRFQAKEVGYTNWSTLIEIGFQWSSSISRVATCWINQTQVRLLNIQAVTSTIIFKADSSFIATTVKKLIMEPSLLKVFMFLTGLPRIYCNYYLRFDNLTLQQSPTPVWECDSKKFGWCHWTLIIRPKLTTRSFYIQMPTWGSRQCAPISMPWNLCTH